MKKIGKIIPLVVGLFIVGCSSDKEQRKVLESFNKGEDIKCLYGAARYTSIISNKEWVYSEKYRLFYFKKDGDVIRDLDDCRDN